MIKKVCFNFSISYPCLTRNFINDRLYHPTSGYFNQPLPQIGELKSPLEFNKMIGYEDYTKQLSEKYPKNAWLTPSELFRPWYGMSIGNYISQVSDKIKQKIRIIEVGAGAASTADSILSFFKLYDSQKYHSLQYHIIELSSPMAIRAKKKLQANHPLLFEQGRIKIINDDIANWRMQEKDEHYFVMMLEVLDNMPHDKIIKEKNEWKYQTLVDMRDERLIEINQPLTDPLIKVNRQIDQEVLEIYLNLQERDPHEESRVEKGLLNKLLKFYFDKKQSQDILYLPTHCNLQNQIVYKVLKNLKKNIPNHHLIIADFDRLGSKIKGINAPIVSKKGEKSHEKVDYSSYLVNTGEADIFFPTDFHLISEMYTRVCGKKGEQVKSYEFVDNFSQDEWTMTKSGYNPLKEDFGNTSFFVTKT